MVVEGLTLALLLGSVHEPHTPLSIESAVAAPPVTCQLKVTCVPAAMVLGDALKVSVNGTCTVMLFGAAVPPGPEALMVNVVVEITGTIEDPEVGSEPVSSACTTGGVIVTDVALAVVQVIVVVWPPFTAVGLAVNAVICGWAAGCTTCTVAVCGELVLLSDPVATAVYVVVCVGLSV